MRYILASASPRRKEILTKLIDKFEIVPSMVDEVLNNNLSIYERIEAIAQSKADDIFNKYPLDVIIAADTVVYIDGMVLGKPKDEADAKAMINRLSGRIHEVITAVCVKYRNQTWLYHEISHVKFLLLTDEEIDIYVKNPEIYDKAGAYAIQGTAKCYVESFTGEYENIVGLPIVILQQIFKKIENKGE